MKYLILPILFCLSTFLGQAQESDYDNIVAPGTAFCHNPIHYRVTIVNIDNIDSLINTAMTIKVFDTTGVIVYQDSVLGPSISPAGFHVFMITIPPYAMPGDGDFISRFKFHASNDQNTDTTSPDFGLTMSFCGISINQAAVAMGEYIEQNIDLGENQVGYLYPFRVPPNTNIKSYNSEEFDMTRPTQSFFAVIAESLFGDFEQPTSYVFMNPINQEIEHFDDINWFPMINGQPWNPFPQGGILVAGDDTISDDPPELPAFEKFPEEEDPRTCALLVSGWDPIKSPVYENDARNMKLNLMKNKFGPSLPDSQIVVRQQISGDSILSLVQDLRVGYDKIYFYYRGHGGPGYMAPANTYENRLTYRDFFDALYISTSQDYCLFIDCCYSGSAIVESKQNNLPKTCSSNIEIVTSATADKQSITELYRTQSGQIVAWGAMTYHMIKCQNDLMADLNNDSTITFAEAYSWMKTKNPTIAIGSPFEGPIMQVQCPDSLSQDSRISSEEWLEFFEQKIQQENQELAEMLDHSDIYLNRSGNLSGEVFSADMEPLGILLEPGQPFGWINPFPASPFNKDIFTLKFEPGSDCQLESGTLNIEEHQSSMWPVLPVLDTTFNAFDPRIQIQSVQNQAEVLIEIPNPISEFVDEPTEEDSICALLVAGYDPYVLFRDTNPFEESANNFKDDLMHEKGGPQLREDQIRIIVEPELDELRMVLDSMRNQYKKVHFFFAGHFSDQGGFQLGNENTLMPWFHLMPMEELLEKLFETGAENICTVTDTKGYSSLTARQYDIQSDTRFVSVGWNDSHHVLQFTQDSEQGISKMTSDYTQSTSLEADEMGNKDGRIGMFETVAVLNHANDTLIAPFFALGKKSWLESSADSIIDTDLQFKAIPDSPLTPYNLTVTTEIGFESIQDTEEVFGANSKVWSVDSDNGRSFAPLTGEITFYLNRLTDQFDESLGIPALIYRASPDDIWTPLNASVIDPANYTITVNDVAFSGQFASATVKEINVATEKLSIPGLTVNISPNPVMSDFVLNLNGDQSHDLQMSIYGENGQMYRALEFIHRGGTTAMSIDISELPTGVYLLRLVSQLGGETNVPFVKVNR